MIHGKVRYRNLITATKEELSDYVIKYPVFRKEKAFDYENEYRFVIHLSEETHKLGHAYYLGHAKGLPFEILINPLLKKKEFKNFELEINQAGFGEKVTNSVLTRWLRPDLW